MTDDVQLGDSRFFPADLGRAGALQPAVRLDHLAMPVFATMWQGYAGRGFDNVQRLLVP